MLVPASNTKGGSISLQGWAIWCVCILERLFFYLLFLPYPYLASTFFSRDPFLFIFGIAHLMTHVYSTKHMFLFPTQSTPPHPFPAFAHSARSAFAYPRSTRVGHVMGVQ